MSEGPSGNQALSDVPLVAREAELGQACRGHDCQSARRSKLWKNQLAIALATFRSREAGAVVKEASDLTNDLLQSNADLLRTSNAEVRQQIERGVFDIEAVKHANAQVIATIEDSLRIADEGKAKRAAAEKELIKMEEELKQTLAAASAKIPAPDTEPAESAEGDPAS